MIDKVFWYFSLPVTLFGIAHFLFFAYPWFEGNLLAVVLFNLVFLMYAFYFIRGTWRLGRSIYRHYRAANSQI